MACCCCISCCCMCPWNTACPWNTHFCPRKRFNRPILSCGQHLVFLLFFFLTFSSKLNIESNRGIFDVSPKGDRTSPYFLTTPNLCHFGFSFKQKIGSSHGKSECGLKTLPWAGHGSFASRCGSIDSTSSLKL